MQHAQIDMAAKPAPFPGRRSGRSTTAALEPLGHHDDARLVQGSASRRSLRHYSVSNRCTIQSRHCRNTNGVARVIHQPTDQCCRPVTGCSAPPADPISGTIYAVITPICMLHAGRRSAYICDAASGRGRLRASRAAGERRCAAAPVFPRCHIAMRPLMPLRAFVASVM